MQTVDFQPWFFQVAPYDEESISHFLGRFRCENHLTASGLGKMASLGGVIARWEKFRFIPRPSSKELTALAAVVGVSAERLAQMLPPDGVGMKHEPIRLCGACYAEQPFHRIVWQYKSTSCCPQHGLFLLSECPKCGARFKTPSLWDEGHCHRCFTDFAEMRHDQKSL